MVATSKDVWLPLTFPICESVTLSPPPTTMPHLLRWFCAPAPPLFILSLCRHDSFTITIVFTPLFRLNSELPPAYKDVVPLSDLDPRPHEPSSGFDYADIHGGYGLSILPPSSATLHPPPPSPDAPSCPLPQTEPEEEPKEVGVSHDDGGGDGSAPPSYKEVIARSPTAAIMHQQISEDRRHQQENRGVVDTTGLETGFQGLARDDEDAPVL